MTEDKTKTEKSPFQSHKVLYFICNAVIIILLAWKNLNGWEYLAAALGLVVLGRYLFQKREPVECAAENLCLIIFIDVLILFVSVADQWLPNASSPDFSCMSRNIVPWIFMSILGFFLWRKYGNNLQKMYLQFAALEAWGAIPIMWWGWSLDFWNWTVCAKVFFLIYSLLNFTWMIAQRCVLFINPKKYGQLNFMTLILYGIVLFFRICSAETLQYYIEWLPNFIHYFEEDYLGSIRIVVMVVVLLIVSLCMIGTAGRNFGHRGNSDFLLMAGIAGAILMVKMTTAFYSPLSYFILAFYGYLFQRIFLRGIEEKISEDSIRWYAPLLNCLAALSVAVVWMSMGLWPMVVVEAVFARMIYKRVEVKPGAFPSHLQMMTWMVLEAVLAVFLYKYHLDSLIMVGVIVVVCFATFVALSWKHPSLELPRTWEKIWLCVMMSLLLFLAIVRNNGALIRLEYVPETNSVSVSVSAREKDTEITEVSYYWMDWADPEEWLALIDYANWGNRETEELGIDEVSGEEPLTMEVSKKRLTLVVTDSDGVETTKSAYFPLFFYYYLE